MPLQETNRSLDRGLLVLESLSRNGPSTLSQIGRDTDLPITTTRRLLVTLVERNFVRRSLLDGRYRANVTVASTAAASLSRADFRFVDHAMVVLTGLTARIKWPCDLHVVDDICMRFVDTTRPLSPYYVAAGTIDRRFNIFGSATGQACLTQTSHDIIEHLIDMTKSDRIFGLPRLNFSKERLYEEIERTRQRGYGIRLTPFLGETILADNLSAIAVPARSPQGALFGIALVFPNRLMPPEAFAKLHIEDLQSAADEIAK